MDRFGINKLYPLPLTGASCWATDEQVTPFGDVHMPVRRQWLYRVMSNDWGLSILHGGGTYSEGTLGSPEATYEVGLVRFTGLSEFEVVLDDDITGCDVLGYQTIAEIQALLDTLVKGH